MNAFALILFASPVLLLILVLLFALIVISIRREDRGGLTRPAENRIDAFSRRVAGLGTRSHTDSEDGER